MKRRTKSRTLDKRNNTSSKFNRFDLTIFTYSQISVRTTCKITKNETSYFRSDTSHEKASHPSLSFQPSTPNSPNQYIRISVTRHTKRNSTSFRKLFHKTHSPAPAPISTCPCTPPLSPRERARVKPDPRDYTRLEMKNKKKAKIVFLALWMSCFQKSAQPPFPTARQGSQARSRGPSPSAQLHIISRR